MMAVRVVLAIMLLSLLLSASGCSWVTSDASDEAVKSVPTLADLQPAVMPDTTKPLPKVDLDTIVATYRSVLNVTDDPELRLQVQQRLAGLEMERGEQALYDHKTAGGEFALAIEAYRTLLQKNPNAPHNDELLYQLSKAYDLNGEPDKSKQVLDRLVKQYPNSVHYAEAQFRRAEIFFSGGDYRNAELAYEEVIKQGKGSVHYANALYMHGWSQFKRERYRASLQSFTAVLDLNVPQDNKLDELSRGQRELTQDTFRVMSVVFSYLDGPKTIAEVYNKLGERHYMPMLYDNLGKLYLEKQRYRDSADAYRAFVTRYPQSDRAPVYYASLIHAYLVGGFADDVLVEKERYVQNYGIHSDYWQQKSEASRDYIRPFLKKYLPELARHFHARAQEKTALLEGKAVVAVKAATKAAEPKKSKPMTEKQRVALEAEANNLYLKAGDYYQQFIDTFPEDEQVAEMYFLLAETRFAAHVYDKAIDAYELVAYKYTGYKRSAVAGYSALLAYGELLKALPQGETNPEYDKWLRLKIASQMRFATTFRDDPHAPAVLTRSAEELLELKEYQYALEAGTQLVKRDPPAEKSLRKTAWLVIGHSEFALQQYAKAEAAYDQALRLIPLKDPARQPVVERLAASVYKQGEAARSAGDLQLAAGEFLRVAKVAPTSKIAVTARFDAANTLMDNASWAPAIAELKRFRRDYPDNPLTADIPAKLVVAYQNDGQWARAGDELTGIYQHSKDEAVKKESLYQAAQMYEKAGDKSSAIARYRDYAHTYPDPFPLAMEARYRLSELYKEAGEGAKRRYWLKQMIAADKGAGKQRTDRSRYLAAMSASVLADDDYRSFAAIKLKLPLKQSLKKKKRALNKVLTSYKAVAGYGVAEYATLATYRIGEIYRQLSRDLLDSQRPKNLDALAQEQYQVLLEEQAYPFEEKAIAIHETNSQRCWNGVYDQWVKDSFEALKKLLPARYGKEERGVTFSDEIY